MDWKLVVTHARQNGTSHGVPHWQWDVPWDTLIGLTKNLAFHFDLRVSRVIPHGSPHCMRHPIWVVPLRAMSQNNACRLSNERRWPKWIILFCTNSIFHIFKVWNLSKYFQILSNRFKLIRYSQKASKTSPNYRNFNFGTLDEAFQTQSFGLPETS